MANDITDRTWVASQLAANRSVTAIAETAGVSRQTAYTWFARHGLQPVPHAKPRPSKEQLAALYRQMGSTGKVADQLDVGTDTARRWLHAAGIQLGSSRRRRHELDLDELRHLRNNGASLNELAKQFNVSTETVRRRLIGS